MTVVRIGTRGSELALAQTRGVAAQLQRRGVETELVTITTEGDRSTADLAELGGTGVFATALREALLDGRCDVLVHSLKDLPTAPVPGLVIAAVPKRADARDALVAREGRTLAQLPEGARVGTGSPRRIAQLRAQRPDLEVVSIRGNVDSRLRRVLDDEVGDPDRRLDAVVLAAAGLDRIGRLDVATELLDAADWPTAPGQGALALETREGEERLVRDLEHRPSRLHVEAERRVLAVLEAGCAAPLGAHAFREDGLMFLSARVYTPDGSRSLTSSHALYPEDAKDPARELGDRVAAELRELGADDLMPRRTP